MSGPQQIIANFDAEFDFPSRVKGLMLFFKESADGLLSVRDPRKLKWINLKMQSRAYRDWLIFSR